MSQSVVVDDENRLCVESADGFFRYFPFRYHTGKVAWDRPEVVTENTKRRVVSAFNSAFLDGVPYANDCYEDEPGEDNVDA